MTDHGSHFIGYHDALRQQAVGTTTLKENNNPVPCKENDPVNHPHHYTYGTIETIDYIEDKG